MAPANKGAIKASLGGCTSPHGRHEILADLRQEGAPRVAPKRSAHATLGHVAGSNQSPWCAQLWEKRKGTLATRSGRGQVRFGRGIYNESTRSSAASEAY